MKRALWLLLPALFAWGGELSLAWLKQKPPGRARDFYVWLYLDRNITAEQADEAFGLIQRVTWRHIGRYARKSGREAFKRAYRCRRMGAKELAGQDGSCIAIGMTPYKFASLPFKRRAEVLKKAAPFKEEAAWMGVMAASDPFAALLKSDPTTFFKVFNESGASWRRKYCNRPIPLPFLRKLAPYPAFATTIKLIVTDEKLNALHLSLVGLTHEKLGHKALFFLALNAIRQGRMGYARYYLAEAYKKAYYRFDKDKVLFWAYLIDGKRKWLKALQRSFDLNIYTIYARELLGSPFFKIEVPRFAGLRECDYPIQDPFAWQETLETLKKSSPEALKRYARRFRCAQTEGHYAFVMERASNYRRHYFPMPYQKALEGLDRDQMAFVYALARQESRMIPASISSSYALGMMQIMPFLVKALAKEMGRRVDLTEMFDPYTNIAFALRHLSFLRKRLDHPLFLAYAYNGGIGFTKRMLKNRPLFYEGKYEPWMSMELVGYDESRRYGKKVLANYIVYRRLLGRPIDAASLLRKSIRPNRKDRRQNRE